jgi:hypothetical protein
VSSETAADAGIVGLEPPVDLEEPGLPISLHQVRSSALPLRWYEVVAIVQGLCEEMIAAHEESMIAGFDTVFIRAQGDMCTALTEKRDAQAAVNSMGRIFGQLGGPDLPAPLKFIVSKASAVPPIYSSIKEFSTTLAYFERPNRVELLQGVHAAWKRLPPAAPGAPAPVPIVHAPIRGNVPALGSRGSQWFVPAAAMVGLTVILISLLALDIRSRVNSDSLPAPVTTMVDETPRPTQQGAYPPVIAPLAAQGTAAAGVRGKVAPPLVVSRRSMLRLPEPARRSPGSPAAGSVVAEPPTPTLETDPATMNVADAVTYTAADTDVVPPVAVYPKLVNLAPLSPDAAAFEIVVTDSGTVESVKSTTPLASIGQALQMTGILSAAKSWRFRPASKDGHSVRYRVLIWLQLH